MYRAKGITVGEAYFMAANDLDLAGGLIGRDEIASRAVDHNYEGLRRASSVIGSSAVERSQALRVTLAVVGTREEIVA